MERTMQQLKSMQAAPLNVKVLLTKQRIREWVNEFGTDGVYVSFSGGKDSTVLLHIVREMYPSITAVFFDTGLEYPEIREFVRTFDNVEWSKPKMTFRQVIEKYGYPFISKEVSHQVWEVRRYGKEKAKWAYAKFDSNSNYNLRYNGLYSLEKYVYMLSEDAPMISHKCCSVMKKSVAKDYEKSSGRVPIVGTMTEESKLRRARWLKVGCNAFTAKNKISNPMSFWTGQDVLQYIRQNNIPIASVYGDIVNEDADGMQYDNTLCEMPLRTTGADRTG